MIFHLLPLDDWRRDPDQPYAPASLATDGFIHCSPDEPVTLAIANAFYRDTARPLLALLIDEESLKARLVWQQAEKAPPGVADDTRFPHVYGPLNRDAVTEIREVEWDATGAAVALGDAEI
ncbi:DUF952 domain-containing protein [Streptomyces scopuliridis]|uniref:Glutathione S-transferase n=1 Tax=Streptomyces scopuliridis RB72 TaxID=1440053 RepID=A0A2T7SY67_9ACTN|nr:DUF952 domain-containing protein [Streptomyces scopuliridis]PVE07856.1 hypothetical protein Y717_21300 [Streptomyces scopuliridis RB72]